MNGLKALIKDKTIKKTKIKWLRLLTQKSAKRLTLK